MKNEFESIDIALNTESRVSDPIKESLDIVASKPDDIRKDYEYTRANLYSLIEKGARGNQWNYGTCRGRWKS